MNVASPPYLKQIFTNIIITNCDNAVSSINYDSFKLKFSLILKFIIFNKVQTKIIWHTSSSLH